MSEEARVVARGARWEALPSLGAHVEPDGSTCFRVWSSRAREVAIVVYELAADRTTIAGEHRLTPRGDGLFADRLPLPPGALYKIRLDRALLPDPYARRLPLGVHGPAEVMAARTCPEYQAPPLARWAIYELHVGTFTRAGTYAAAAERLPELAALGVTTIELLPLAAFPGRRGWGYDGVGLFAPFEGYGSPDELRGFVEQAHALGLAVILDVVYNHLGPEGNYLASYSPEYFAGGSWTPWGQAPDFACPWVRRLVIDSATMWLCEYGFDGLRLDATQAIVDPSPVPILAELAATVRALPGRKVLIAEDGRQDPRVVTEVGLDALWADDFHHAAHVLATRERDGYYGEYAGTPEELARTIARGLLFAGQPWLRSRKIRGGDCESLPAEALVYCLQNHDQVGNRALGERLHHLIGIERHCALAVLLLFLPATPLLWMGEEWAASSPWQYFTDHPPELGRRVAAGRRAEYREFPAFADPEQAACIPDPQDECTYARSRLDWDERSRSPHREVLALYGELLRLRREDPVLRERDRSRMSVGTWQERQVWVRRWGPAGERLCVFDPRGGEVTPPPTTGAGWRAVLAVDGAAMFAIDFPAGR
jgi:maltooligosyltrehalose trehalohydrolase